MKLSSTVKSSLSLYCIQVSNLVIPVLTLPWLASALGVDNFGLFGFILAITAYLNIIVDFGFNLTGPRDVAVSQFDVEKRSMVFWGVICVRIILFVLTSSIFLLAAFFVPALYKNLNLYYIALIGVVNALLNPTWFFQGLGKLVEASLLTLAARLLSLPFLFFYVRGPEDIDIALAIQVLPGVASSVLCLYLINRNGFVNKPKLTKEYVVNAFITGLQVFLTNCVGSFYSSSYLVLIGLSLGSSAVGLFSVADRIIKAFQALMTPISMAAYHIIAKLVAESDSESKLFILRTYVVNGLIGLFFAVTIFYGSEMIIEIFFSEAYRDSVTLLKILCFVPLCFGLHQLGYLVLVSYKRERFMSYIYLIALLLACPIVFMFFEFLGLYYGAAFVFAVELIIAISVSIFVLLSVRRSSSDVP